jgi:hypothetical protein
MIQNKETIEQSILAQQVYLDIVRGRHLRWAGETDDPELKRFHTEIAGLLQQTRDEYYGLLTAYQTFDVVSVLDIQDQSIGRHL